MGVLESGECNERHAVPVHHAQVGVQGEVGHVLRAQTGPEVPKLAHGVGVGGLECHSGSKDLSPRDDCPWDVSQWSRPKARRRRAFWASMYKAIKTCKLLFCKKVIRCRLAT